jgi:ubiquinone/menaquinone biosynthesis C-methylase UbiE
MGIKKYESWWDDEVVSGKCYTIKELKTILGNADSRKVYLDFVKDGSFVLDVGCGLGLDYEMYCQNDVDVNYVGIDICRGFIKYNKTLHPEGNFIFGKSYELPFADKAFDIATTRHVLEHLKEAEPTIREMCRVAKQVAIIWFIPPQEQEERMFTKKGFYKNTYSRPDLEKFIHSLGFKISTKDFVYSPKRTHQLWNLTR